MKSSAQIVSIVNRGIAAVKAGDPHEARRLLSQAARLDPANEQAWLWLSEVARTPEERRFCIDRVLSINPDNLVAKAGRRWLEAHKVAQARTADTSLLLAERTTQSWSEVMRRVAGVMVSPILAAIVNAKMTVTGIKAIVWTAIIAGTFGAYIWASATYVPRNPGMRFLLGDEGLDDKLLNVIMQICGALVWIVTFGLILMET